jgi:hypothetical protein
MRQKSHFQRSFLTHIRSQRRNNTKESVISSNNSDIRDASSYIRFESHNFGDQSAGWKDPKHAISHPATLKVNPIINTSRSYTKTDILLHSSHAMHRKATHVVARFCDKTSVLGHHVLKHRRSSSTCFEHRHQFINFNLIIVHI